MVQVDHLCWTQSSATTSWFGKLRNTMLYTLKSRTKQNQCTSTLSRPTRIMQDEQGKTGTNRRMPSNQPMKRKRKKPVKCKDFITFTPPKKRPEYNVPKQTSKAQLLIRNCAVSLDWFPKVCRPAQRYVVFSVLRNRLRLTILIWRDPITSIRPCGDIIGIRWILSSRLRQVDIFRHV